MHQKDFLTLRHDQHSRGNGQGDQGLGPPQGLSSL